MLTEQEQKILDNAPEWATHFLKHTTLGFVYAEKRGDIYANPDNCCEYFIGSLLWDVRYDLADLRKKQGKTVVDAVNYFKANSCNSKWGIIETVKKDPDYRGDSIGDLHWGDDDPSEYYKKICTTEEFSQCVKEMSEYLVPINVFKDYLANKTPLEPVKPVYTQAMKDAGELPSVGMECNVKWHGGNTHLAIITYIGDGCFCYVNIGTGKECANGGLNEDICEFLPIDTRTNKQSQVDSAVQDIMSAMFNIDEKEAKAIVEMLQEREHLMALTPEPYHV